MRIAHVTDCYLPRVGGIERQVSGLAAAQASLGHEVEVITSVSSRAGDTGDVVVHRPYGAADTISYSSAWSRRRLVLEGDYDVVHVHASTFSPLAYASARAAAGRIPVALTLHSLWSYARPVFAAADPLTRWRTWPLAWSAVSRRAADELGAQLSGPPVDVLPNGIDPRAWQHAKTRHDKEIVLVSTMRLEPRKRPVALLKTIARVRHRLGPEHPFRLVLIGTGSQRALVQDRIRRWGLGDRVELTGALSRDEVAHAYSRADVYIAPAKLESFGIAALEAQAAGLPVIAFRRSGIADFVRDGRDGILVDSDLGMVEALCGMIGSDVVRHRFAHAGEAARSSYGWDTISQLSDDLYRRAARLIGATELPETLARSA